ncbi:uncharacterized protein ARMOST_14363 [Armillaria ostoyae]|uniref:Uncharacterized protein n=1 Tax=Armillaria ostoyae TaxID=47428 RepID=A0A284RQC4_ARMOS|nr:uncharacterized protein ARMOST_14363 [Armillaria ostoyae]
MSIVAPSRYAVSAFSEQSLDPRIFSMCRILSTGLEKATMPIQDNESRLMLRIRLVARPDA